MAVRRERVAERRPVVVFRPGHQQAGAPGDPSLPTAGVALGGVDDSRAFGQHDLHAFRGREHLQLATVRRRARRGGPRGRRDESVVVGRIMVKQDELAHARLAGEIGHVVDGAVPPAALCRILMVQVLRIVDEHVGAFEEGQVPYVAGVHGRPELPRRLAGPPIGLMVAGVDDRVPADAQPIAERRARYGSGIGSRP